MGLRCGKEAPDGGLKERESPRLEDGANSRGYHSSFSMGAQPTRMAGQSYCRLRQPRDESVWQNRTAAGVPRRDSAESLEPSVVTPLPPSAAPLAHRRPSRNRAGAKGIPAGNGRCRLPAQRAAPWPSRGRAASNADLPPSWRLMLLAIAGRSFGYALLRLIVAVSASALGGCGLAWANDASNSQASAIAAPSQFSPEIPSQSSSLAR